MKEYHSWSKQELKELQSLSVRVFGPNLTCLKLFWDQIKLTYWALRCVSGIIQVFKLSYLSSRSSKNFILSVFA